MALERIASNTISIPKTEKTNNIDGYLVVFVGSIISSDAHDTGEKYVTMNGEFLAKITIAINAQEIKLPIVCLKLILKNNIIIPRKTQTIQDDIKLNIIA